MKQNATLIEERAISLREDIVAHFHPDEEQQWRMKLLTGDLETYTNDLLEDIDWLSSGQDIPKKEENSIITKAKYTIGNEFPELLNFREQFNKEARHYWQTQKTAKTSTKFSIHYEFPTNRNFHLQMHGQNFRYILRNLLDNAVKYVAPNTVIKAKLIYTNYGLKFTLSNQAPCLKEGEKIRLFKEMKNNLLNALRVEFITGFKDESKKVVDEQIENNQKLLAKKIDDASAKHENSLYLVENVRSDLLGQREPEKATAENLFELVIEQQKDYVQLLMLISSNEKPVFTALSFFKYRDHLPPSFLHLLQCLNKHNKLPGKSRNIAMDIAQKKFGEPLEKPENWGEKNC